MSDTLHRTQSAYSDGAPIRAADHNERQREIPHDSTAAPSPNSIVGRVSDTVTRIRSVEGLRGYSARALVFARKLGSLLSIVAGVYLVDWSLSVQQQWEYSAHLLLFSVTFILGLGAVGTIMYPEARYEIVDRTRELAFSWTLFPAVMTAVAMKGVVHITTGPDSPDNQFLNILIGNGLPLVFFSVVFIPAIVFAQYIFRGLRAANRKAQATEESMAEYMRHDPLQR